jgi:ACR3 family arsenite transporter
MTGEACAKKESMGLGYFERYLSLWVGLCIVAGIILGKVAPGVATYLDSLSINVNGAPVVSLPIAVCLTLKSPLPQPRCCSDSPRERPWRPWSEF